MIAGACFSSSRLKLRHLQHDIINTLLPFYMIADDIYFLYFIFDICDTMSVTAIKRNVCAVFAECVEVRVVNPSDFLFFSTVGVLITVVAMSARCGE